MVFPRRSPSRTSPRLKCFLTDRELDRHRNLLSNGAAGNARDGAAGSGAAKTSGFTPSPLAGRARDLGHERGNDGNVLARPGG